MTVMPNQPVHLLLVAPCAPPKSGPEAMQVGRFLSALNPEIRVTLVTTPTVQGWEQEDSSLAIHRSGLNVIILSLPVHRLTHRVLCNHRLAAWHMPDSDFWLPWFVDQVIERLDGVPDAIYSRSVPFSAALLAQRLKRRLGCPWMMHLSDPWSGSPYRHLPPRRAASDLALEANCISEADHIALTTKGQVDHYRARYPQRAQSMSVTPNMMAWPIAASQAAPSPDYESAQGRNLTLVHTGALYGSRNPIGLLKALDLLRLRSPELAKRIRVHFVGNLHSEIAALIDSAPECTSHRHVSFVQATRMQAQADIVLSIEPKATNSMYKHFLLSKVVDYLASGRPILALTPTDSLTANYCKKGYGWAFSPDDAAGIAEFLESLLSGKRLWQKVQVPPPPIELNPFTVTQDIERHIRFMISNKPLVLLDKERGA